MATPSEDRQAKLQSHLKRTLKFLDSAIIDVTSLDPKLQRALTEMHVHRDDELGRLLVEVGRKAGLLDSARTRAAFVNRHGAIGDEVVSASEIHSETTRADQERFTLLDVDLPQPMRHGSVSIGVDALAASPTRYQLRFHLENDVPFDGTLPLLTGIHVTDQTGRAYRVENGREARTAGGVKSQLFGTLEFAPDHGSQPVTITLAIASVLFADRQAFLVTEAPAQLVEGPWEFTITVQQDT